jgi:hypothetical protein
MPFDPDRTPFLQRATSGFALAALVVATVAVVVPQVDAVAASDASGAALADANAIGAALRHAIADLGDPRAGTAHGRPEWLFGPGVMPRGAQLPRERGFPLSGVLVQDRVGGEERWRGPYVERVPLDPWGRAYVVRLGGSERSTSPIVVVSAGPDGVVDTQPGRSAIAGDDVGIVLTP